MAGDPDVVQAPGIPLGLFSTDVKHINLQHVNFLADHRLMNDNRSDQADPMKRWQVNGTAIASGSPHWQPSSSKNVPASITRDKELNLELRFDVDPADADEKDASLEGSTTSGDKLTFDKQAVKMKGGWVPANPASTPLVAKAKEKTPHLVSKMGSTINWTVNVPDQKTLFGCGSSGPHTIYATMDTPQSAPGLEAGITMSRMDKAVTLVAAAASDDPHAIAAYLQSKIPTYTLVPDPAVPAAFHHPGYFAGTGQTESGCGAWPVADFMPQAAECQAIIRFVRAVMKQVGCSGDMPLMVVFADPNDNATVKEQDWDAGGAGLGGTTKVVNGKTWKAWLLALPATDPRLKVGQLFDSNTSIFNNFEACLKLTTPTKTRYYGGGAGDYDTKEQVIKAFGALCWTSIVTLNNGDRKIRIEDIVKKF